MFVKGGLQASSSFVFIDDDDDEEEEEEEKKRGPGFVRTLKVLKSP